MKRFPAMLLASWAAACAGLAGCGHAPVKPPEPLTPPRYYGSDALRKDLGELLKQPFSGTQSVDVIYATNRAVTGDPADCDDTSFGITLSDKLSYGVCTFNVPKRHQVGSFELAPNPRADPHQYYRLLNSATLDPAGLAELLRQKRGSDILVFIHGFNVKFQEAVLRAAQIAYDLKFQGPVILFSWPAGAEEGMFRGAMVTRTYAENLGNALKTVPLAQAFFGDLAASSQTVHVMVHSMGHQVTLRALAQLSQSTERPFIGELILNAPDFPVKDFQKVAPQLQKVAGRVTVYCSYNDNAIAASESYNKSRRMGACERVPGTDMINVGEIDAPTLGVGGLGHGYYSGRPILTDIFQALLGIPAEKRLFIRKSEPNSTEDYYLRP
ncbi:MAG: alpha/beta hydrolase [Elusimicrobia bacterium]|nr:alpha/beta hydrolase [Elusimicrobiota bacterium]